MKRGCYWEEYGSTRAKDSDERPLMRKVRERQIFLGAQLKPSRFSAQKSTSTEYFSKVAASRKAARPLLGFVRHKRRRGVQPRWKIPDESGHRRMPAPVISEKIHFLQSL